MRVTQVEARGVSAGLVIVPGALCDSGCLQDVAPPAVASISTAFYQHMLMDRASSTLAEVFDFAIGRGFWLWCRIFLEHIAIGKASIFFFYK